MASEASDSAHLINPISLKSAYFPASRRCHKKPSAFCVVLIFLNIGARLLAAQNC